MTTGEFNGKSICVYCGSQPGNTPAYMDTAWQLGKHMAQSNYRLVFGSGTSGIMGQVAKSVKEHGGVVVGIIPEFLFQYEANGLGEDMYDEVHVTDTMHERKQKMFELSDALVALPGGIGTLEEIVEIMTWAQLGRHTKPMAFLNTNGFWNPMLDLLNHMKSEGFFHQPEKAVPNVLNAPSEVTSLFS